MFKVTPHYWKDKLKSQVKLIGSETLAAPQNKIGLKKENRITLQVTVSYIPIYPLIPILSIIFPNSSRNSKTRFLNLYVEVLR